MSEPTTLGRMLSDTTQCKRFARDVAIHWYPADASTCHCGELERPPTPHDSDQRPAAGDRGERSASDE